MRVWLFVGLLALAPVSAQAQWNPPATLLGDSVTHARDTARGHLKAQHQSLLPPIAGGLVGGVLGTLAGGWIGYQLTGGGELCGDSPCGLYGGILGSFLGESLGLGLGVYAGDGRRARANDLMLAAAGVGGAALFALGRLGADRETVLVLTPIVQLAAAIGVSRAGGANGAGPAIEAVP